MKHSAPPAGNSASDSTVVELERLRLDLAARDRTVAELLQSRRKYELLIETTDTGYVILDTNGLVLDANAEYVRLTGHQRLDDIIGRSVVEWTAKYDRERNAAEVRKCFEHGSVRHLVIDYIDAVGRVTPVEINATMLVSADSTTILTICRDISERRRAEQALFNSEEQYRSTIDAMSDLIHVVDPDLRIVLVNRQGRAWMTELGIDSDPVGRTVFEAFPFLPEPVRDEYAQVFASAVPLVTEDSVVVDGKTLVTETRKIPVVEAGRVVRVVTVVRNMTEAVYARERLRQGEKMEALGQLAGGVAHDFNNQLTGMLGYAELLARRLQDPELRAYANMIARSAARSGDLTRQLLAFARQGRLCSVPVDIHSLIADVVALLRRTIDRRIVLRQRLDAAHHVVVGDPTQLQNTLLNLAINARDAMPEGGALTFTTRDVRLVDDTAASPDSVMRLLRITVEDTGVGMTDEVQRRLFEPFFTTKPPGHGTGMGLPAVYGTVADHQGAIRVSSAPGQGSVFTIDLPLTDVEQAEAPCRKTDPPPSIRAHVLLADDEPEVRGVLAAVLRQLGYTVTECADGDEALEHFRTSHADFDLVVLDVFMPRLSGALALREMRQLDPNVRAILLSGHAAEDPMKDLLAAPTVRFLPKPVTMQDLGACVAAMLARSDT